MVMPPNADNIAGTLTESAELVQLSQAYSTGYNMLM